MKMIPIPASQLRNQIVDIREAIVRDNKIFEITDNGKSTGVILMAKNTYEDSVKKKKPDFSKIQKKLKGIFDDTRDGAEIARELRNNQTRYRL